MKEELQGDSDEDSNLYNSHANIIITQRFFHKPHMH